MNEEVDSVWVWLEGVAIAEEEQFVGFDQTPGSEGRVDCHVVIFEGHQQLRAEQVVQYG